MVNAQTWLDENYPIQRRNEIINLDIGKGKVKRWDGHERTLKGDLKLVEFTNLRTLKCSSQQITSLDVSECKNLRELDCQGNQLNSLNINGCTKLQKINCASNDFLEEIDISNCSELNEVGSGFTRDTDNNKLVKGPLIIQAKESEIRNILIIGWAGNGKSTLANVISETNIFTESSSGVGQTINFQKSDIFQWNEKSYRIVDNVGFGDNNFPSEVDILHRIGEGIYSAKEGINQVLFVFSGRFSEEQISAFNMFKKFISESRITEFTTLVRTNFPNFRNQKKCEDDRQVLLTQNRELREIIESCKGIVYVDNPAMPVIEEEDSEEEKEDKSQEITRNEKKRKESRKILLNHLAENCRKIYKLKEWDNIYSLVVDYIRKKEEIEKSDSLTKEEELKKTKAEVAKEINKGIKASVGVEVPGLPLGLTASIEYNKQKINW